MAFFPAFFPACPLNRLRFLPSGKKALSTGTGQLCLPGNVARLLAAMTPRKTLCPQVLSSYAHRLIVLAYIPVTNAVVHDEVTPCFTQWENYLTIGT
jgi:hypothetical protein